MLVRALERTLRPRGTRNGPGSCQRQFTERWEVRNVRTTVFKVADSQVAPETCEVPAWGEPDENGQAAAVVQNLPDLAITLYRIPIGCTVPIHAGHCYASCQIVSGRGKLVLPSGEELQFVGPELFMFEAGALHGWKDIVEDTLLTVCELKHPS